MAKSKRLVRITTNNQVAIPAKIVRQLKLTKGSYLEVEEKNRKVVMTPKRLIDEEDFAMYERIIREGRRQLSKGEVNDWDKVKTKMSAQGKKR